MVIPKKNKNIINIFLFLCKKKNVYIYLSACIVYAKFIINLKVWNNPMGFNAMLNKVYYCKNVKIITLPITVNLPNCVWASTLINQFIL